MALRVGRWSWVRHTRCTTRRHPRAAEELSTIYGARKQMRHHTIGMFGGVAIATTLFAATASADDTTTSYFADRIAAPSHALELKVGTGYTQGLGNIATGRGIPSVAGAGLGANLDIDYRLNQRWSIGIEGQYQEFNHEENTSVRGLVGNVGATYHFAPTLRGDPWIRLGTGYRMVWENDPTGAPGTTPLRHGFELGAAQVGYDIRLSEDVAISPVIGADATMFLWQDQSGANNQTFSQPQVASFVFGGLQGRFDIGGDRVGGRIAKAPEPVQVTAAVTAPPPAPPPPPQPTSVTPSIAVSQDIMDTCKLDLDSVDKAPKFDFNRIDLLPADMDVLQQVATCFTTGPMKGMSLDLVGRADPRGTAAYNEELGLKRAQNVAEFMKSQGVSDSQLQTRSRGALDAQGTDEASYSADRRVDIMALGRK